MAKLEKGSSEAKEWAEKMKAARNAKRSAAYKAPVKEKNETNASITAKSKAAFEKRQAAMSPEERRERDANKARIQKALEADKKKASPSSAAPAPVKKVQKAVKQRAAEEGVKVAEPSAAQVKTFDAMTLKELRAAVKEARTVMCPPVGKMKQVALIREIDRLNKAGGTFDVLASVKDRRVGELRKELRELRRKHCPPVSKMRKGALLVEALALKEAAAKLEEAAVPSLEEYEQRRREGKEEAKPMLEQMRKERAAARAMEKRAAAKQAKQTEIAMKAAAEVKPEAAMGKEEAIKEFLKPVSEKNGGGSKGVANKKVEMSAPAFEFSENVATPNKMSVEDAIRVLKDAPRFETLVLVGVGKDTNIRYAVGGNPEFIERFIKEYADKHNASELSVHRNLNREGGSYYVKASKMKKAKAPEAPAPAALEKKEPDYKFMANPKFYKDPDHPTYSEFIGAVHHSDLDTTQTRLIENLITDVWIAGYGAADWKLPKLPHKSIVSEELKELFPKMTKAEINEFVDQVNKIRYEQRQEVPRSQRKTKASEKKAKAEAEKKAADRKKVLQGKAKAAAAKKKA